MEVKENVKLRETNLLAMIVWSYVFDQIISMQGKIISVRIESIFAVLNFLKIPKWKYEEIIQKIRILSKFYHLKKDISNDWKMGK